MEYVKFGRTGLFVSRLALGTGTFGFKCDETTSVAILDKAFDNGINFLDTANTYPIGGDMALNGRTEEIVGKWMRGKRDEVVLTTKCSGAIGPHPWDKGNSRKAICAALEASLRTLQTDYIDLYQLHFYDPLTPADETLRVLDDLIKAGKVRYAGCSNYLADQRALALGRSDVLGVTRLESVSFRYNLLFREWERELIPLCQEADIATMPYNPLAGGMLTGAYSPGAPAEGSRFTLGNSGAKYTRLYWNQGAFDTVDQLRKVSENTGRSIAELAAAWVLANPATTAPVIGADEPAQLDDFIRAAETPLDPAVKRHLDDTTAHYRLGDAVM